MKLNKGPTQRRYLVTRSGKGGRSLRGASSRHRETERMGEQDTERDNQLKN